MDDRAALEALATDLGVLHTFVDGLERTVKVPSGSLAAICTSLGVPLVDERDAPEALRAHRAGRTARPPLPPVVLAWDGLMPSVRLHTTTPVRAEIELEDGRRLGLGEVAGTVRPAGRRLPPGYHTLRVEAPGFAHTARIISAPTRAWRRAGTTRSWGVGTHLGALRSRRSGAVGDLTDLETVCRWVGERGGDLVTALPLLPTFNTPPVEPSPYSPVSRLFWSELILDRAAAPGGGEAVDHLDVARADAEVRALLADVPDPGDDGVDPDLALYARFRGAQRRLGRNWRDWPEGARGGRLLDEHVDPEEARFHRVAQTAVRQRLRGLQDTLERLGVRLGLDLAVGVHPDGFDPWARPHLFARGMSVGAPPDPGFPSGQDWGFAPVLPSASQAEGHDYVARSIAHQASLAGVLRVDHIMALTRLYWIPHGVPLHQGTYVHYPTDEMFAVLTLESHRRRCEIIGENLGTVPPEIDEGLPRHGIRGMVLAIFEADAPEPTPPAETDVAMVGTHDTPTFVGWLEGRDIEARVASGLLDAEAAPAEREARAESAQRLADTVGGSLDDPGDLFDRVLDWIGRSDSPLVVPWIEDLWLEPDQVNLPGTRSSERPNWQRTMARPLEDLLHDPAVEARVEILRAAREQPPLRGDAP